MSKPKPELRVKPRSYKPTEEELNEVVRIDATPEELARAVLRQVEIVEEGETDCDQSL